MHTYMEIIVNKRGTRDGTQLVEHLPRCKKPVQYPAPNKPDIEAHICNLRTQGVEVGGSEIQGHSKIHSEFKGMLGYMRSCLQRKVSSFMTITEMS